MLDKNFTPPKERIAMTATKKRVDIIEAIVHPLAEVSTSILLTGSMAYGQDYSVTPDSDIDLQLTVTPEIIHKLTSCKFFQKYNLERIIKGFNDGIFQQFSLQFVYKEVLVECHFWDENTLKEIMAYKREKVVRLRGQKKKVSTDFGYSFDGQEDSEDYPDYKEYVYNLGTFPSYRIKDKTLFLCRPITNILGNSIVLFDDCDITGAIESCRAITEEKIEKTKKEKGKTYSIYNALPGKNKVSEEVKIMLI